MVMNWIGPERIILSLESYYRITPVQQDYNRDITWGITDLTPVIPLLYPGYTPVNIY